MQPIDWTPFLVFRLGAGVFLLVLLARATLVRVQSWRMSDSLTDPMVRDMREDRLIRIVIKHVIHLGLLGTLYGRFFLMPQQRAMLGDIMLALIALALVGLLVLDEVYAAKMLRHSGGDRDRSAT